RIAVMHQGSVQQFDEPATIYNRPANMFVAGFMGSPAMNFLPAELSQEGGRPAVALQTADGKTASLPIVQALASDTPRQLILGIRPEHIYRFDPDLARRKPGIAQIDAVVELVEPTGAETMAVLRLGGKEITGRFDPDGTPLMGETVTLGIDMARACLFDPTTQRLI
ncbi:MAG: ABC transporter ATP-binding protein, partial [Mesorhizobium sp.]